MLDFYESSMFSLPDGGVGCFSVVSRLNHSCEANCAISKDGDATNLVVLRNIQPGEELTTHFNRDIQWMASNERSDFLESLCKIDPCICRLCSLSDVERITSDCRRLLMRHLRYWFLSEYSEFLPTPGLKEMPDLLMASGNPGFGFYLFAQLAYAEGVVADKMACTSFTMIIHWTKEMADATNVHQLPIKTVRNTRNWWRKANKLKPGSMLLEGFVQGMWNLATKFVTCVGDDGKINWAALGKPSKKAPRKVIVIDGMD